MNYRIWSLEHGAWWRPNDRGYTVDFYEAGVYSQDQAINICISANFEDGVNEAMVPTADETNS